MIISIAEILLQKLPPDKEQELLNEIADNEILSGGNYYSKDYYEKKNITIAPDTKE